MSQSVWGFRARGKSMKAVGLTRYLAATDPNAFLDVELPEPTPGDQDLLVSVQAVSVNPVDTKVRTSGRREEQTPRVLGWDAAGIVKATGNRVTAFTPGDHVYYAGDITRSGSNAQLHCVDARIAGHKPKSLSFAEAAALPLASITAWEALFDRLQINIEGADAGKSILIVGGAGGVGSIAIQLARQVAGLEVVATASRDETRAWVRSLGANEVINHREALDKAIKAAGLAPPDFILCLNDTAGHWLSMTRVLATFGRICSVVETDEPLDLMPLKRKCGSFSWESMFTRSMLQTSDMVEQHHLLNKVAALVDQKRVVSTANRRLSPISADTIRQAHMDIERGDTIGKIVIEGWTP